MGKHTATHLWWCEQGSEVPVKRLRRNQVYVHRTVATARRPSAKQTEATPRRFVFRAFPFAPRSFSNPHVRLSLLLHGLNCEKAFTAPATSPGFQFLDSLASPCTDQRPLHNKTQRKGAPETTKRTDSNLRRYKTPNSQLRVQNKRVFFRASWRDLCFYEGAETFFSLLPLCDRNSTQSESVRK
uniref:Uncharacterized protein n=1 Tax=Toxoplasma gondii (strain ATCC 50861 / VEG) TaxID=432359 RepID=A0A0F7V4Z1_TOXGV|nr:TPA: hypothetical protein BN1205_097120 [Toxoplasma gondii VEG]